MNFFFIVFFLVFSSLYCDVDFASQKVVQNRSNESKRIYECCKKYAAFYELKSGESYRDITEDLLQSPLTKETIKNLLIQQKRRIIVFSYPSDGHQVKGTISLSPDYETAPLLVFLRGGNRILGLKYPANDFNCMENYTILATTYRGGINEGNDEFGGMEVDDVENLIAFIPQLEKNLSIKLSPKKKFLLGGSRGGLEMFLALERSPFLQSYFDKAISLSGLLDLRVTIANREDMKRMFIRDFGLILGDNEDEWIDFRNPIHHSATLKKELPLLIIQGTEDHRAHLDHGRNMISKLREQGNQVTYWEIQGGTHCLSNRPDRIDLMVNWLEQ